MVCSHYYYHRQSQQTTIFPETAQESGGSCPTTSAYLRQLFALYSNIAPLSGIMPSPDHRLNIWSLYKSVLFTLFIGLLWACHILIYCSSLSLPSLNPGVTNFQGHSFSHPSSFLYHLLPPPHDTSVLSRFRTATRFTRPISRTKNTVPLHLY